MNESNYHYYSGLQKYIKSVLPTSPHSEFENQKIYKTIKKQIDELYDAETLVQVASRAIDVGMTPIGVNYHFYIYMAERYAKLFVALKSFESTLKRAPVQLKEYYSELVLPDSKTVYTVFKEFLEYCQPIVESNLQKAKKDNPNWDTWDDANIDWDQINLVYKKACK